MSASSKKKLRKELEAAQLTEKQLAAQKEAKKLKAYTVTFTAVVSVVLVVALIVAAFSLISSSGILPRTVKAVTVGEHTLTSAELNYFYIDAVNETYNNWKTNYGDMLALGMASIGLTPGKPLDEQDCVYAEGKTWAEYFADMAVAEARNVYALYDAAVAANHTMSEDGQANLDMIIQMMSYYAAAGGYSTTEEYLKSTYGNGASMETYKAYMSAVALGNDFATKYYEDLSYTDDDIAAYNDEHASDFNSYSYSQFYVDRDDFVLCTDSKNSEHVHTADEYAPALKKAEEAAQQLVDAKPTDASELNTEITKIEIYKDLNLKCDTYTDRLFLEIQDENLKNVDEWLLKEDHKAGDMTYVPISTTNADGQEEVDGYLVLLFTGMKENNENLVNVRHILINCAETASEETRAAAKKEADDLLAKWLEDGGTEDAFKALVKDNSDDPGSAENEGLYEDVYPGQMVPNFNDWCFDESRKAGDYGIVETEHGYHLMYYVGPSETTFRNYMVENTLRNNAYNEWTAGLVEKTASTVHSIQFLDLDMALNVSAY